MPNTTSFRTAVWGPLSTRVRQSQVLRKPAVAGYRAIARTVLVAEPPKVLANSMPKAGTHLLTQLLGGVDRLWFSGLHVIDKNFRNDGDLTADDEGPIDPEAFAKRMRTIRNGQFVTAHLTAQPAAIAVLDELGFRRILMIRDPRDIAVSMAFYLSTNQRLHTYERFAVRMTTPEQRLMATITGLPREGQDRSILSIGDRLRRYRPWLDDPQTCVVRFEELVGAKGGGSDEAQFDAVRRVLRQCNRDSSDAVVTALARSVFATHSKTFRRGAIATWPEHFTDEHRAAFDSIAGDDLAAFGYA